MWRRLSLPAALLFTSACSKLLGIEDFSLVDAGIDAVVDAPPDARLCYGEGLAPICLTTPPSLPVTLDQPTLDTAMATTCTQIVSQTGGPDLCVIAATDITVSNTVVATGARPLVLLATNTIMIGGTLDVSSKRTPARVGAGGNFTSCGTAGAPQNNASGAGGGAGGTFQTRGASGGDGNAVNNNGTSPALLPLTFVRGGCRGSNGATGAAAGGAGGAGGGAVYLYAATEIIIAGNVYASGAGAGQGGLRSGGGGGGSGGFIGIESPSINVAGIVSANGGNGSGGGGDTGAGGAGADGSTNLYSTVPAGAAGGATSGGVGGRGTAGATTTPTVGGQGIAGTGGGGGGGGAGFVWVKGAVTGTKISPAPTVN